MTLLAPSGFSASAQFDEDAATPSPFVYLRWTNLRHQTTAQYVRIYRDGVQIARVNVLPRFALVQHYSDLDVVTGGVYDYSIQFENNLLNQLGAGSKVIRVAVPLYPASFTPAPVVDPNGPSVNRWTFTDVYQKGPAPYTYEVAINPNDGGSPTFEKSISVSKVSGPNEMPIIQEGAPGAASISFSGVILTQEHYEALEIWFRKRILLMVQDDLGRRFYGVFASWTPQRVRRSHNYWYHTYNASMTVLAYYNASGQRVYGRFL